jgi:hypothetical protein
LDWRWTWRLARLALVSAYVIGGVNKLVDVLAAVAMLFANDFWTMAGHDRFMALNAFLEHFGLIASLVTSAFGLSWETATCV